MLVHDQTVTGDSTELTKYFPRLLFLVVFVSPIVTINRGCHLQHLSLQQ